MEIFKASLPGEPVDLPEMPAERYRQDHPLLAYEGDVGTSGIVASKLGPLLVVARLLGRGDMASAFFITRSVRSSEEASGRLTWARR